MKSSKLEISILLLYLSTKSTENHSVLNQSKIPAVEALITEDIMTVIWNVNTVLWPHSVSINPNLKPEVARWASASESLRVDCGRTGGHSFCQTERDWWSGLERWPGVFSYSNGRDRDSWTQYIGLCVCMCAYLCSTVYVLVYMEMHCVLPERTEDMK